MTFQDLIKATGELLGLEELVPDEDGFCTLESEDGAIDIAYFADEYKLVLLHAVVSEVPAENSEAVILKALEANCGFKKTGGATLSINPDTGCFELARFFALEVLEPATLLAHLERFALSLVEVREMLKEGEMEDAESRKEDAVDEASSSSDPLVMGSHCFVRV